MAKTPKVVGLQKLISQMQAKGKAHFKGLHRGLRKGVLLLLRESQKLVPHWQGHLEASGYARESDNSTPRSPAYEVGYTAEHAVYVHENLDVAHGETFNKKYAAEIKNKVDPEYYFKRRPQEQAKFLERPLREKEDQIAKVIAEEAAK